MLYSKPTRTKSHTDRKLRIPHHVKHHYSVIRIITPSYVPYIFPEPVWTGSVSSNHNQKKKKKNHLNRGGEKSQLTGQIMDYTP